MKLKNHLDKINFIKNKIFKKKKLLYIFCLSAIFIKFNFRIDWNWFSLSCNCCYNF